MFEDETLDLRPTTSTVCQPIVSVRPTTASVQRRNVGLRLWSCRLFESRMRASEPGIRLSEGGTRRSNRGVRMSESRARPSDTRIRVFESETRPSERGIRLFEPEARPSNGGIRVFEGGPRPSDRGARLLEAVEAPRGDDGKTRKRNRKQRHAPPTDGLVVPALDGALNFRKRAEKRRRLSERSEFASFSARLRKFKEGVAISGAPFFAYFLWQDKESESAPAGDETGDAPPRKTNQ